VKRLLIIFFLMSLTSCTDRYSDIEENWTRSVDAFDKGDIVDAQKFAEKLGSYSSNKSDFLVGQYMMYGAAKNGLSFGDGLNIYYKKLALLDISDVDPSYKGHFIAAQAFAERFLHGESASSKLFSNQCNKWFKLNPKDCVGRLFGESAGLYASGYAHLDSLYLYEVARLASDLKLSSPQVTDFYAGIALLQIDENHGNFVIDRMHSHGELTPEMGKMYCRFVNLLKVAKSVLECGK